MAYQLQQYYDGDNCSGNVVLSKFLQLPADSSCNPSSLCIQADYGYATIACPDAIFPNGIDSYMTSLFSSQNLGVGTPYVALTYWNDPSCATSPNGFMYVVLHHCLSASVFKEANANSSFVALVNNVAQIKLYSDNTCHDYLKTTIDQNNTWGLETQCDNGLTHRRLTIPSQQNATSSNISVAETAESSQKSTSSTISVVEMMSAKETASSTTSNNNNNNSSTVLSTLSIMVGGVLAGFFVLGSCIYWFCFKNKQSEPKCGEHASNLIDSSQPPPYQSFSASEIERYGSFERQRTSAEIDRFEVEVLVPEEQEKALLMDAFSSASGSTTQLKSQKDLSEFNYR